MRRPAAALPVVLLTLAISSALVVSGMYLTRQLVRSTSVEDQGRQLELLAEGTLASAVAEWDSAGRAQQSVGSVLVQEVSAPTSRSSLWITRVSHHTYWLVAESVLLSNPMVCRRLGLVLVIEGGRVRPARPHAWAELPGE